MFANPVPEELRRILKQTRRIAVIGLSDRPDRTSFQVSRAMQQRGYQIIPVNPFADTILGEKAYARVGDIEEPVDLVNIFRRSDALPEAVEEASATSAPVIWAQLGIYHEDAAKIAMQHEKTLIMDTCILIAYNTLM